MTQLKIKPILMTFLTFICSTFLFSINVKAVEYDWYIEHDYDYIRTNIMTEEYEKKLDDVINTIETFISSQENPDNFKYYIMISKNRTDTKIKMNIGVLDIGYNPNICKNSTCRDDAYNTFQKSFWTASYYQSGRTVYVDNGFNFKYHNSDELVQIKMDSIYLDDYNIGDYTINYKDIIGWGGDYPYFGVDSYPFANEVNLSKIFNINQFTRSSWSFLYYKNFDMPYSDTADITRNVRIGYKINGAIMHDGNYIPSYLEYRKPKFQWIYEGYQEMRSVDFYIKNTNLKTYDFELTFREEERKDYSDPNLLKTVFFYGLKNENGLYHWEAIPQNETFYMEYKEDSYSYDNDIGIATLKGKVHFELADYEEIRVVHYRPTKGNYYIQYKSSLNVQNLDIDINHFGNQFSRYKNTVYYTGVPIQHYVVFSTPQTVMNGAFYIQSNNPNFSLSYYDPVVGSYVQTVNGTDMQIRDELYKYSYIFGYSMDTVANRSIYLQIYGDSLIQYKLYLRENQYFTFSDDLKNVPIKKPDGSTGDINIDNDPFINDDKTDYNSYFSSIEKLLKELQATSDYCNHVFSMFFDSLPSVVQLFLIGIYTLLLIYTALHIGGW